MPSRRAAAAVAAAALRSRLLAAPVRRGSERHNFEEERAGL